MATPSKKPLVYRIPAGVQVEVADGRPVLTTTQGGRIALDSTLLELWQQTDGKDLSTILENRQGEEKITRLALACLAEAGLLLREGQEEPATPALDDLPAQEELVSVIIINHDSHDWLGICLSSLKKQTGANLEIIVVDNGSQQDPRPWLEVEHPVVRLQLLSPAQGLAAAINQGVSLAQGKYLMMLNPDVRLEADAINRLVQASREHPAWAAAVPKLKLSWAPGFLNGLGNHVAAAAWGTDNGLGHLDLGQFDAWQEVPSACFAAALIPRRAWEKIGPLDEAFPMYYEDSEWSYRARIFGYSIGAVPQATGYHAFGGKIPGGQTEWLTPAKLEYVVLGRMRFAAKLLSTSTMLRFLVGYLAEDWFYLLKGLAARDAQRVKAILNAWKKFRRSQPELKRQRHVIQSKRQREDKAIFSLQRQVPPPLVWNGLPELTWDLVSHHYLPLILSRKTRPIPELTHPQRLLIISQDLVDENMAGPGMRYLEMARALSPHLHVTLAFPGKTQLKIPEITLAGYRPENLAELSSLIRSSDVILASSFLVEKLPDLRRTSRRLVIDLYDPFMLENLFYYQNENMPIQESFNQRALEITRRLLQVGDYFICAHDRQRDYWLGALAASGRVNPHTFSQDPSLRKLIDVVGMGIPARSPTQRSLLRGKHPAFPPKTRIVLWGGGLWDWLDPLTLVQAWPRVVSDHPEARLVFLGTRHPNPDVPPHRVAVQAEKLAEELGEKERTIFFFEWLPYEERERLLSEADIGVVLHSPHIETRFSLRTRVVDYLWAQIPILVSEGDVTSDWVTQYRLGRVVPSRNAEAVSQALNELLDQPKGLWKDVFEAVRQMFSWEQVVAPLKAYCLSGVDAPDRQSARSGQKGTNPLTSLRSLVARAGFIRKTEGLSGLLNRLRRAIQWRLGQLR